MIMEYIGSYSVPVIIVSVAAVIMFSKADLFSEFISGCRKGFADALKLLPSLIILLCAVRMFSASGALDFICSFFGSFTEKIGIPKELIPVIITRPISGSAATAMINNLFESNGPDSFVGRCASIIMGSSDTIIYTLAMYFGAAGVRQSRYALPAAFAVFGFCVLCSVAVTRVFF